MKNGIIINGKQYELVEVSDDAPLNYCEACDMLDVCNMLSDCLCRIFVGEGDSYFKLKKER
jgi:hypothetical protein